ncbi:hypothetical protein [Erwinia pyrifoliae]|uniref:Uncharacterized protein n=1 Tax=Erwinia pyrifoliae TaxID=79967 RepID=A0ABY5X491_ERWPY|nr:hypothetical protein [Erwinia pyrifoliae]AUX72270.1 hypothetical protein CPI84_07130 [Erwinia pyrifoliae]MCA8877488.1 hypothetical protein [Erwinia pyrifoliae]MCT2388521.1 hypothetical protein [Erwinia pyrifoliae]MCU8586690.1 hypothetical protein [Erwinia pyrifoliae]UWS30575.1 hypothetical protein NYP81_03615 [Erwinia pyrifoliae]
MSIALTLIMICLYLITSSVIFHSRRTGEIIAFALVLLVFGWLNHFSTYTLFYTLATVIVNIIIITPLKNREHLTKLKGTAFLLPLATLFNLAEHFIS